MPRETWLVTGGAGFIGSNFAHWALANRPETRIVVLDCLTYAGSLENLRDIRDDDRLVFEKGDIANADDVARVFDSHRPTQIVNFAAESHVDRSIDGPRTFIETNIRGTFELLEAARSRFAELDEKARETYRFLHVSTDEVYGSLGPDGFFTEETPYAPNSPYSASKASADLIVRAYNRTYGLPTLITNCSNNYGPYQLPEKLIPLILLNAMEGKPLPIYGDGGNVRDWIYVEDHCRGIARVLEAGRLGEQYLFGGHSERSNLQVVDAICDALEQHRPAAENPAMREQGIGSYKDLKSFVEDRPGHDRRYAIDSSKAERELDWSPAIDFESAIVETVAWYLAHQDWQAAIQAEGNVRDRRGLSTPTQGAPEQDADTPGAASKGKR